MRAEPTWLERMATVIERHPAKTLIFGSLGALLTIAGAFGAGFNWHKEVGEAAGMDSVQRGSYVLKSELANYVRTADIAQKYIERSEVQANYLSRTLVERDYIPRADCYKEGTTDTVTQNGNGNSAGTRPAVPVTSPTKQITLACGNEYQWLPDYSFYQLIVPPDSCWTNWQRPPKNFWWGTADCDGAIEEEYLQRGSVAPTRTAYTALNCEPCICGEAFRFRNTGSRSVTINVYPRY
jgi:hypothetical protein